MKRIINIILWISGVISLYIILCVGLEWFWTIGFFENAEKINQVLINLSYSYFAGLFFFLLVTQLPYIYKKEKFKPVINEKVKNINSQIFACVQTFERVEIAQNINITKDELSEIINKTGMYENSFYAIVAGYQMNNFQFLVSTREQILGIISSIKDYKEYINEEKIINIEKIKDSSFLHLISHYEDSPAAQVNYSSNIFRTVLIDELYLVITYLQAINK